MKRGYTTIEQSKRLLELGINPESADMCYVRIIGDSYNDDGKVIPLSKENAIPKVYKDSVFLYKKVDTLSCWSLTALIELMPVIDYSLPDLIRGVDKKYYYSIRMDFGAMWETNSYDTPIDAAVEFIEWAVKNGYVKTNK